MFRFVKRKGGAVDVDLISPVSGLSVSTGVTLETNGEAWSVVSDGVFEGSGIAESVLKYVRSKTYQEIQSEIVTVSHEV